MKDDHSNRMTKLELGPGKGHLMEPMVLMDDKGHLYVAWLTSRWREKLGLLALPLRLVNQAKLYGIRLLQVLILF